MEHVDNANKKKPSVAAIRYETNRFDLTINGLALNLRDTA